MSYWRGVSFQAWQPYKTGGDRRMSCGVGLAHFDTVGELLLRVRKKAWWQFR